MITWPIYISFAAAILLGVWPDKRPSTARIIALGAGALGLIFLWRERWGWRTPVK